MKTLFSTVCIVFIIVSCGNKTKKTDSSSQKDETTTFYLVRHAEKDVTIKKNPPLTAKGEERAKQLASYLKNIDAVYSTNYKRTLATALYTAAANNITTQLYKPNQLFDTIFLKKNEGKRVLIVGHSNTTPQLVNKMTGKETHNDIPEDIYNRLYKVVLKNGKVTVTVETLD